METPTTEEQLVNRAREGDRAAFDRLIEANGERVRAFIRARLGERLQGETEVEDILQESCLKAFRSLERFQYRGDGSFSAWLATIAEYEIRQLGRSRKPSAVVLDREPADSGPSPSRVLRREERQDRLETAITALSADHQTVIRLARIEGLPIAEVARRMDRSPGAVRHLLFRALEALRTSFGDETASLRLPAEGGGADETTGGNDAR